MALKRRPPRKRHVIIRSAKGGASVPLSAIPGLEKYHRDLEKLRRQKEHTDLDESLSFVNWLADQPALPFGPDVNWNLPVFRLMYGGAPALSIMGSFGAGGRFNPGMAQVTSHFTGIRAQACLYVASTLECCYAEAQPPYGDPQQYELTPKRGFVLWDMEKVLHHYNDPLLNPRILNSPLDAIWSHQKIPMTSQLLAAELRRLGGDGILMSSTKRTTDKNIALFFNSDAECAAALDATRLALPHPDPVT